MILIRIHRGILVKLFSNIAWYMLFRIHSKLNFFLSECNVQRLFHTSDDWVLDFLYVSTLKMRRIYLNCMYLFKLSNNYHLDCSQILEKIDFKIYHKYTREKTNFRSITLKIIIHDPFQLKAIGDNTNIDMFVCNPWDIRITFKHMG